MVGLFNVPDNKQEIVDTIDTIETVEQKTGFEPRLNVVEQSLTKLIADQASLHNRVTTLEGRSVNTPAIPEPVQSPEIVDLPIQPPLIFEAQQISQNLPPIPPPTIHYGNPIVFSPPAYSPPAPVYSAPVYSPPPQNIRPGGVVFQRPFPQTFRRGPLRRLGRVLFGVRQGFRDRARLTSGRWSVGGMRPGNVTWHLINEHGIPTNQVRSMSMTQRYALHDSIHEAGW